jgi:hypothetical protein
MRRRAVFYFRLVEHPTLEMFEVSKNPNAFRSMFWVLIPQHRQNATSPAEQTAGLVNERSNPAKAEPILNTASEVPND